MEQIQIFEYKDLPIRAIKKENEIWWVLKDVCMVLEISKYRDCAARLDDDERELFWVDTPGGKQQMICVNESGVYNVILRSDKEKARPFKRWITKEVIPSIRKHGAYITPEKIEEIIYNPELIINLAVELKNKRNENQKLLTENSTMKPKAEYFDELVDRNLLTNFRDTAKELKVKETDFITFLLENKYIYRNSKGKLLPYAEQNNHLFEVKETLNSKTNWVGVQTLITPKGRETFRLLLKQNQNFECFDSSNEDTEN